jgi:hypothetical protein
MLIVTLLLVSSVTFADTSTPIALETSEEAGEVSGRSKAEAWALSFMTKYAPPGRKTFYAEAQETKEEAELRYEAIARDLVEVVYDPANRPLFSGSEGRTKTMAVMLAVALYESGFGKNVDYGVGKFARGDNGKSWCLLQVNVGAGRAWPMGWNVKEYRPWRPGDAIEDQVLGATGPEMVADRKKCFVEALRGMRLSFNSCASRPVKERLNVYASGDCSKGSKESRIRMTQALKFLDETKSKRTFKDTDVR